jgi:hypothetical protein
MNVCSVRRATTQRLLVNGEYYLQHSVVVVPFGERRNAEKEDFGCLLSTLILVGKEEMWKRGMSSINL